MNWSEAGALTIFTLLFAVIAAPSSEQIENKSIQNPQLGLTQKARQNCEELVKKRCNDNKDEETFVLAEDDCSATLRLPTDSHFNDEKTSALFSHTQKLLNLHLTTSLEYLLIGSKFNQWNSYRAGFRKYFDALSDGAWNDAVELIHHMTKRGYKPKVYVNEPFGEKNVGEYSELEALAVSLDREQTLASTTMDIMSEAHSETHDPEMFHYLSEHLSDVRTKKIKTSANHVNTLYRAVTDVVKGDGDGPLALHIYDTQILLK